MVHRSARTTSFGYRLAAHLPPSGLEVSSPKSLSDTSAFLYETQQPQQSAVARTPALTLTTVTTVVTTLCENRVKNAVGSFVLKAIRNGKERTEYQVTRKACTKYLFR